MSDPSDPTPPPGADAGAAIGTGFSLSFVEATVQESAVGPGAADTVPSVGGAYVLRELIGAGGQGQVWEAWQASLRRVVAVKIHKSGDSERFVREALLTGDLDHPGIVPVLDLGSLVWEGSGAPTVAMAMKRLRGMRWDELIARERGDAERPPTAYLRRHLAILESVAQALSYAHSRGVLHLDLKPGQVIVGEFGEVYLCDWGMAARFGGDGTLEFVSAPTGAFGTPGYMAPEQALGDLDAIGVATDVYLLGALAHHVITGAPPHPGATPLERLDAARRNLLEPSGGHIAPALRSVVTRALAAAPPQRHTDAESFRAALNHAVERLTRDEEAADLCAAAKACLDGPRAPQYAELAHMEQQLDRAIALSPDYVPAQLLRDGAVARHAALAIDAGDLALARVLSDRIRDAGVREETAAAVAAGERAAAAREAQRIRARRTAFAAMGALLLVLVAASLSLYAAFTSVSAARKRTETEYRRAESALADSQRELARASVQAAMSYLDKHRPADAREALRRVPAALRGWEWGYLASRALPESRLLRPRTEGYKAIALSGDGSTLAAIAADTGALLILRRMDGRSHIAAAGLHGFGAVGRGSGSAIVAGSNDGQIVRHETETVNRGVPTKGAPIDFVEEVTTGTVIAVDRKGTVWEMLPAGDARPLLDLGERATALSTNGGAIAVGTESGAVWHRAPGGEFVKSTAQHRAPVRGIEWHPAELLFVTWAVEPDVVQSTRDSRAFVHLAGSAEPIHVTLDVEEGVTAAAWSPDGKTLALAFSNAWLHRLETERWTVVQSNYHDIGVARLLHYTADGSHLTIVGRTMIQTREMQWFARTSLAQVDPRAIGATAADRDSVFVAGEDGGITEWRTNTAPFEDERDITPDRILSLDASPDGRTFAAAQRWGWVALWETGDPAPRRLATAPAAQEIHQVRLAPDGQRILAMARTGQLELFQLENGELRSIRQWNAGAGLTAIAWTGHDSFAAALAGGGLASGNGTADALAIASPARPLIYSALQLSPDGRHLFAGAQTGVVDVLDARTLAVASSFSGGHTRAIRRIAASADGKRVLTASDDETASLWDAATGGRIAVFRGSHAGAVTAALLSHDGTRVLTACEDSILRVFDAATADEVAAFQEHQYGVADMIMIPGDMRLVTAGGDSSLRTWIALPWDGGDAFFDEGAGALRAATR